MTSKTFPQGPILDPETGGLTLEWFMYLQNAVIAETGGLIPALNFPALTGDITTPGGSLNTQLKLTGTPGTYTKTTFDAQGRETSGGQASASDLSNGTTGSGTVVLSSGPTFTGTVNGATINLTVNLIVPVVDSGAGPLVLNGAGVTAQTITGANTVFSGTLKPPAGGYLSSDGTVGLTQASTPTVGRSITVKDGLVTAFS